MRSRPVAQLLADLGITKSHSRPHVSNDNPHSEAGFKNLNYCPELPERCGSIEVARAFCADFCAWYNTEHRHSGIAMFTPADVHYGRAGELLDFRTGVLDAAYAAPTSGSSRARRHPGQSPPRSWINRPLTEVSQA
jgi:putative transposase